MKNKFLLLILFTIYHTFGFAQPLILEWQNCFGGAGNDNAYDITYTGDGYLIAGSGWVSGSSDNALLIKTDLEGNFVWEHRLGGSMGDIADKIFPTMDGNYFMAAETGSSDGDILNDPFPGSLDYWLLKVNGEGEIIWGNLFGGNYNERFLNGATPTSDGGMVAFGSTCSEDGDISIFFGAWDAWMIKIDSLGNKLWDFTIGTNATDYATSIIEASDRGFLAAAVSYPGTGGNIECEPFNEKTDIVLFKLDSLANPEWQKCYRGSQHEQVSDMIEITDGYLLAGTADSNDGDVAGAGYHLGYDHLGNQTSDIWLIKIDFTGNIMWSKCYGGTKNEYSERVFQTEDGGFIVFGETGSFDGDVTGNHSAGPGISDIWVIRIDSIGQLLWQQCIGGNGYDRLVSGVVDNGDGSFVIASTIYDFNSGQVECPTTNGSDQVWLIKVRDTTVVSVHEKPLAGNSVKAYPNPANDYVIFEKVGNRPVVSPPGNPQTISITDIYGREIAQIPVTGDIIVWDAKGVKPGFYLFRIGNGLDGETGKLLISH